MRHVNRQKVEAPAALTTVDCPGQKERDAVCDYHDALAAGKAPVPEPKFTAYGLPEVRQALTVLFHGKCAYCESRYAATQPMDVEHYRPKSAVAGAKGHCGYYWLAADWQNLLPCCIDCNRARTQQIVDGPTSVAGKGTYFPLADEKKRASHHSQKWEGERPLLLNPCDDDPQEHIEFTPHALARATEAKRDEARGTTSISIYGLNRTGLVMSRQEVVLLLQARMISVKRILTLLDEAERTDATATMRLGLEELLSLELGGLFRFAKPDRPYSAMCEQLIEAFARTTGIKPTARLP